MVFAVGISARAGAGRGLIAWDAPAAQLAALPPLTACQRAAGTTRPACRPLP